MITVLAVIFIGCIVYSILYYLVAAARLARFALESEKNPDCKETDDEFWDRMFDADKEAQG